MAVRYIYNTMGDYVAFVQDNKNLFDPDCNWLGFISNGNEVYLKDGAFLGYLIDDDRIVKDTTEVNKANIPIPLHPLRPLRPLRPLKRLRMTRLPHPYIDIFENGIKGIQKLKKFTGSINYEILEGANILAADGTYLGTISRNKFDTNSIANTYGNYGSPYSVYSIFNKYANYGGPYSTLSPFNPYTNTPPSIIKDELLLGYLTANQFLPQRIDVDDLIQWLGINVSVG